MKVFDPVLKLNSSPLGWPAKSSTVVEEFPKEENTSRGLSSGFKDAVRSLEDKLKDFYSKYPNHENRTVFRDIRDLFSSINSSGQLPINKERFLLKTALLKLELEDLYQLQDYRVDNQLYYEPLARELNLHEPKDSNYYNKIRSFVGAINSITESLDKTMVYLENDLPPVDPLWLFEKDSASIKHSNLLSHARTIGEVLDYARLIYPGKTSQPIDIIVISPDRKKYLVDLSKPKEFEQLINTEIIKISFEENEQISDRNAYRRTGWTIKIYTKAVSSG